MTFCALSSAKGMDIKMKHFYFASCTSDGGVYHYIWKNRELQFLEKWGCDCPMYLLIEGKRMWILLRQPFKETPESGVVTCLLDRKGRIKENENNSYENLFR